jgi:hypothetical protein
MGINYTKVVKLYEQQGDEDATRIVREAFEAKEFKARDFDFGKLFAECFGYENFVAGHAGESVYGIMEAAGAVSTAAFQNISGQIIFSAIMEKYQGEEFVFRKLIPEQQTNLSGEKIPGISQIGDVAEVVNEADPFPLAGVREDWIRTPETLKRGFIVPLTREAIFFDRTGVLLDRAGDVGYWLGYDKEKRAIDCFIDENTTAHRYNWRDNVIATYGDNSGTHTWDNYQSSNGLVDWTDVEAAEILAAAITDPNTGAPILIEPTHIIVTKQLEQTARRIIHATEVRVTSPGFATSANPNQTTQTNPYLNKYDVLSTRLLAQRLQTDTDWFLANPSKTCKCMVNFPLQVKEAPPNSHDEFTRDIVQQWRTDLREAYVVVEPRLSIKSAQ